MAERIDRAYLDIDGEEIECDSIEISFDGSKEPRETMNRRNRPSSHKHGVPKVSISAEFPMDLDHQTKFVKMQAENTRFTTVIEYAGDSGGSRTVTVLDCEIYEANFSASVGDNTTISLEIQGLDWTD